MESFHIEYSQIFATLVLCYLNMSHLIKIIMKKISIVLTGNRTQHIRDEDLDQSLVQDVVTAPHP